MFASVRSTTLLGVVGRCVDVEVLAGLGGGPLTFDQLVERLHLPIAEVALRLGRLEAHGWVVANAGWWEALVGG